jgi:hypothetical protein
MADTEVICANQLCRVAEDGKCVEGYDELTQCPFYGREPDEEGEQTDAQDSPPAFDGIELPDALALRSGRADRVLAVLPSRMIGIVGAYNSGKTSIISGLFDLFQTGPVADVKFAGSSTLHGLEMICHDVRVASERDEAHSERTKRGEVRFYHLDVRDRNGLQTLLIADRSGEEYEEVADLTANASAMFELRRADVITVLVDGRRLSLPAERADAIGAIPLIIQGMIENEAFARRPNLAIVLTKDDAVQASARKDRVQQDFEAVVERIRTDFADNFGELRPFVTSASPKDTNVARGAGLTELLEFWLKPNAAPQGTRLEYSSGRVIDRLVIRESDVD